MNLGLDGLTAGPSTPPTTGCICPAFGDGPNPVCQDHGWWLRDPHALHLADLTRELGSAWDAARQLTTEIKRAH